VVLDVVHPAVIQLTVDVLVDLVEHLRTRGVVMVATAHD
jgi:hypothetical protein